MASPASSEDQSSPASSSNYDYSPYQSFGVARVSTRSSAAAPHLSLSLAPPHQVSVAGLNSPLHGPARLDDDVQLKPASTMSAEPSATSSSTLLATTFPSAVKAGKRLIRPPPSSVRNLPLLVTGVPLTGAKSRVETQIKIRIALAVQTPNPSLPTPSSSASSSSSSNDDESNLAFISSFTHVKLQRGTATKPKRKSKKAANPDCADGVAASRVLHLETEVYCASEGLDGDDGMDVLSSAGERPKGLRVLACQGCRAREIKRAQRKLAARVRPTASDSELDMPNPPTEGSDGSSLAQDERAKIVLFNSGSTIDFSQGECFLPARVTCYCRHHKEKLGFLLCFILRDHLGNVVAQGTTPPIMITDDHKSSASNRALAAASAPTGVDVPTLPKALIMPSQPPPPSNTVPKVKARRAVKKRESSASGDEDKKRRSDSAKPYQRKAVAASGGPSARTLSMTPMTRSVQNSPAPINLILSPATVPPPSTSSPAPPPPAARPVNLTPPASIKNEDFFPAVPLVPSPSQPALAAPQASAPPTHMSLGLDLFQPLPCEPPLATPTPLEVAQRHFSIQMQQQSSPALADVPMFSQDGEERVDVRPSAHDVWMEDVGMPFESLVDFEDLAPPASEPFESQPHSLSHSPADSFPSELPSFNQSADSSTFESLFDLPASPPSSAPSPSVYGHGSVDDGSYFSPSRADSISSGVELQAQMNWPALNPPDFSGQTLLPLHDSSLFELFAPNPTPGPPPPPPPPTITRLIPGEGPMHGGIEVTILGQHFVEGLTCLFGDSPATRTQLWSDNTLVCTLPPSACPGPVVVALKSSRDSWPMDGASGRGHGQQGGLQLFTYLDNSDRALMELALQVVGLKMTGRIEDAKNVALRIVGHGGNGNGVGGSHPGSSGGFQGGYQQNLSQSRPAIATSDSTAAAASEQASSSSLPWGTGSRGGTFQDTIISFLGLLDVEPEGMEGAAPGPTRASTSLVLSKKNKQGHTLLHLAVMLGFHRLVARLVSLGADLDARDRNGYSALALAALCGRVACARLLIEGGASDEIVTADGKSPLEIAVERDQVDVESLFARAQQARSRPSVERRLPSPVTSEGSSIDADNPSSEDERLSDDLRETRVRPAVHFQTRTSSSSFGSPVLSAATFTRRRRASIDSQRTEGTIYSARPMADYEGYLSDGGSVRHPTSRSKLASLASMDSALPLEHVDEKPVDGKAHVESWLRRTLSNLPPQKFPFPHLPSVADIPSLGFPASFPASVSANFPFFSPLPSQLNFSQAPWPSQLNPWSRDDKAATVDAEGKPTWAHYAAAYPWLPFALAEWWKEMAPTLPPMFQQADSGASTGPTSPKAQSRAQPLAARSDVHLDPVVASASRRGSASSIPDPAAPSGRTSKLPAPPLTITKASFRRQLGYELNGDLTDREISKYGHAAARRKKLKEDKMIWLFWGPILAVVLCFTLISHLPIVFAGIRRVGGRLLPFRSLLN